MARIPDKERGVFAELGKTVLDNFNPEELMKIQEMAEELRPILADAKKRQQAQMKSGGNA